jgi:hypothetical protein
MQIDPIAAAGGADRQSLDVAVVVAAVLLLGWLPDLIWLARNDWSLPGGGAVVARVPWPAAVGVRVWGCGQA